MSKSSVGEPPAIPTRSVPPRLGVDASKDDDAARAASLPSKPPAPSASVPTAPARRRSRRVISASSAICSESRMSSEPLTSEYLQLSSRRVILLRVRCSESCPVRRLQVRHGSREHGLAGARLLDDRLVFLELVQCLRPHLSPDSAHPVASVRSRARDGA